MTHRYLIKDDRDLEAFRKIPNLSSEALNQSHGLESNYPAYIFYSKNLWTWCPSHCETCELNGGKGCAFVDRSIIKDIPYNLVEERLRKLNRLRNV